MARCSRCGAERIAANLNDGVCPKCCHERTEYAMAHREINVPIIARATSPAPLREPGKVFTFRRGKRRAVETVNAGGLV